MGIKPEIYVTKSHKICLISELKPNFDIYWFIKNGRKIQQQGTRRQHC